MHGHTNIKNIHVLQPPCKTPDTLVRLEWSVWSSLHNFILFDGRGVFTLLPKVQLHVSVLDNSHLKVAHESLESSYTRFNMGCTQPILNLV